MTIVELRDRLNEIIKENESHNWSDRNDNEMAVKIKVSKRKSEWRKVKYVCASQLTLPDTLLYCEMVTEDNAIWRG